VQLRNREIYSEDLNGSKRDEPPQKHVRSSSSESPNMRSDDRVKDSMPSMATTAVGVSIFLLTTTACLVIKSRLYPCQSHRWEYVCFFSPYCFIVDPNEHIWMKETCLIFDVNDRPEQHTSFSYMRSLSLSLSPVCPSSRRSSDQLDLMVDGLPVSLPSYEEAVYGSWGQRLPAFSAPGPTQLLLAQEAPVSHPASLNNQSEGSNCQLLPSPENPPPPYQAVQSSDPRDSAGDVRPLHVSFSDDKDTWLRSRGGGGGNIYLAMKDFDWRLQCLLCRSIEIKPDCTFPDRLQLTSITRQLRRRWWALMAVQGLNHRYARYR